MATPGPIRKLWLQWKTLQMPWRNRWLIGYDLKGNTYWEFKDAMHSNRNRRIVEYSGKTHYSDVNVPPQWMQWLRHTRFEPPSIADQEAEVFRQERMKMLAAQADAKWAAKPSALDAPDKQQPMQMLQSRDPNSGIKQMNSDEEVRDMASKETDVDVDVAEEPQTVEAPTMKTRKPMRTEPKDSPWKQAPKGNPGDEWQPAPWSPGPARRRA